MADIYACICGSVVADNQRVMALCCGFKGCETLWVHISFPTLRGFLIPAARITPTCDNVVHSLESPPLVQHWGLTTRNEGGTQALKKKNRPWVIYKSTEPPCLLVQHMQTGSPKKKFNPMSVFFSASPPPEKCH
jgi:hypothetical protein